MIILDTHVLFWYIHGNEKLTDAYRKHINSELDTGQVGISIMSCWEIAKSVQLSRIKIPVTLNKWFDTVFSENNFILLDLNLEIIIDSTNLPGIFHRDPFDQLIVATARIHDCELATCDSKILAYPHVKKLTP